MLGWRDVPVVKTECGRVAGEAAPVHRPAVRGRRRRACADQDAFERKLYVIRQVVEHAGLDGLNIASFSSRTVVYKGMLSAPQLPRYYPDLRDERLASALALVHSRFSTNTFPSWELAHPYRMLAHNGEINTLRGNRNWMRAREMQLASPLFGDDVKKLLPLLSDDISDSASLDRVMELLVMGGRSPAHAISMMIPEAYSGRPELHQRVRDFYAYHSSLIEPWDGPAAVAFTDGRVIGATLDRNGLRPGRWLVTRDGWVALASETGVLDVESEDVQAKGRLRPGKLFLVDVEKGTVLSDAAVKRELAERRPYGQWLDDRVVHLEDLPPKTPRVPRVEPLRAKQLAFGWSEEDLRVLLAPMARDGRRAQRLDGQRRLAGGAERPPPAAVLLLQAAVRAGHQPGGRPHPRVDGDEPPGHDRPRGQPARRDLRALPPAGDVPAAAVQQRVRAPAPGRPLGVRGAHDRHDVAGRGGPGRHGAPPGRDLRARPPSWWPAA